VVATRSTLAPCWVSALQLAPELPEVPEEPELPDDPELPEDPDEPELPDEPEEPGLPDVLGVPDVPASGSPVLVVEPVLQATRAAVAAPRTRVVTKRKF